MLNISVYHLHYIKIFPCEIGAICNLYLSVNVSIINYKFPLYNMVYANVIIK